MTRLAERPGERIDRSRTLSFTLDGKPHQGFEGDTIGSALYAAGRRTFSRSFKYHRPRGLQCCVGHCANCQMTVDGIPNVRVCTTPLREGAVVSGQNTVGSLDRDLMRVTDKLGGPFTPPGFYYKTFMRPRRLWPLYEKFLRGAAGLGPLDPEGEPTERVDVEHRHVDVVVVGGGQAGLEAAREAADRGDSVLLVDEGPEAGGELLGDAAGAETARALCERAQSAGAEVIAPATAIGIFEGNLVPIAYGDLLLKVRAERVVVAGGVVEQPLVFPGNDLVGIVLPSAVRRLVNHWSILPGERAVVVTADDRGLNAAADLENAGAEVVEVVDLREQYVANLEAQGQKGRVGQIHLRDTWVKCDLVVMSGSPQPNVKLLAQAGARVEYDTAHGIFVPTDLPEGVEAVGSAAGEIGEAAVPEPILGHLGDKCFVCFCEDQTTKDLKYAISEGFSSIELSKRYTTVTMGPCQGRLCQVNSIRVHAKQNDVDENTIGTTTARPPYAPVTLGQLAGRPHEPAKRTSLHHRHKELGAEMMWAGPWRRPFAYSDDPGEEAQSVHRSLGLIDVSTLGKLLVRGSEAGAFLDRVYPNRFSDLKLGRIRYGVLTTDAGRIMDDGTVARLGEELYYVTTTSSGASAVYQWLTWWNAIWQMDVDLVDVTGAIAAVNVAGPHARTAMERVTDIDVSNDAFAYLDAKHCRAAGVPTLALRIGFVGELGYELHFPSPHGEHVWDTLLERGDDLGARPFGLEPQRILRLEKGHVIVGQDTDSESNLLEAAMPWIFKADKTDFVGKWGTQQVEQRGLQWMLVGFESLTGALPLEGGQVVVDGRSSGRVTSARYSAELDKVIGLAVVPNELAVDGGSFDVQVEGRRVPMTVHLGPFFDPKGERLKT